ncbi:hypothetical protein WICMUC_005389 [Wickerhamomyces mucosus]|uniref:Conserved oligomeric Golgi complex subunit 2 n=1 Tax=Wickerhamomyces mucosus TaxID=1378264 RepID=A0A9P8P854_9ASCO|nr:hypothetical protein WICMUC_005389 [Wickerhamomyces mucosus]
MSNIADEPNFSDIIDFKNELFPYPKKVTRASFLKDLEINASDPSSSIQSLKEQHFDVDKFLNENYRFTLLEDLQTELNILLKELDKELFDLVNDDYFEFIKLGKALDGGEGLVDSLRVDVTKYNKKLIDEADRLEYSQKILKDSLENIESLRAFKVS